MSGALLSNGLAWSLSRVSILQRRKPSLRETKGPGPGPAERVKITVPPLSLQSFQRCSVAVSSPVIHISLLTHPWPTLTTPPRHFHIG